MEQTFITITHLDDYDASRFLYPGSKLTLKKTPNEYDDEAITVYSEKGSKYGYVANSSSTVARGTHSAGYIHRDFEQETACIVRFLISCGIVGNDCRRRVGDIGGNAYGVFVALFRKTDAPLYLQCG